MCWEYIDIIASNIPQMKITAVSQWTATFNTQRKLEKCWCLLRNLSSGLFDHKKIPGLFKDFSKISAKFQDFPGLFSNFRTFQDWWEPSYYIQAFIQAVEFSSLVKWSWGSWGALNSTTCSWHCPAGVSLS